VKDIIGMQGMGGMNGMNGREAREGKGGMNGRGGSEMRGGSEGRERRALSGLSGINSYINYPVVDILSNTCINNYLDTLSPDILTFDISLQLTGTTAATINDDPQALLALRSAGVNSLSGVFLENFVILSVTDSTVRKLRNTDENGGVKETDNERFLRHNSGKREKLLLMLLSLLLLLLLLLFFIIFIVYIIIIIIMIIIVIITSSIIITTTVITQVQEK
jgi:type IV secretory pathway VirB6-like protein